MNMKIIFIITLITTCTAISCSYDSDTQRVGVVDEDRIFNRSSIALSIRVPVVRKFRKELERSNELLKNLVSMEKFYKKNFREWSKDEQKTFKNSLDITRKEYLELQNGLTEKIRKKINLRRAKAEVKIKQAIDEIIKENNLVKVYRKGEMKPNKQYKIFDITEKVLEKIKP